MTTRFEIGKCVPHPKTISKHVLCIRLASPPMTSRFAEIMCSMGYSSVEIRNTPDIAHDPAFRCSGPAMTASIADRNEDAVWNLVGLLLVDSV